MTLSLIFSLCLWSHLLLISPSLALLQTPSGLAMPSMLQVCSTSGPWHLLFPLYRSFFSQDIHMDERIIFYFLFFRSLHKSPSLWGLSCQKLQLPSPHTPILCIAFHLLFSLGHTTIWKLWAAGHTTWFCKHCFIGTQPYPFTCMLSVAVFTLQWQSWTAVTETTWPTTPRMFTVQPLTVCWPPSLALAHCLTHCLYAMRSGTSSSFAHYDIPRASNSIWRIVGAQ